MKIIAKKMKIIVKKWLKSLDSAVFCGIIVSILRTYKDIIMTHQLQNFLQLKSHVQKRGTSIIPAEKKREIIKPTAPTTKYSAEELLQHYGRS